MSHENIIHIYFKKKDHGAGASGVEQTETEWAGAGARGRKGRKGKKGRSLD